MTPPVGRGDVRALRAPSSAQAPSAPPNRLVGRTVRIRPVEARDYDFLFRLYTDGDHLVRYRLRGSTPSPEAFLRFLWDQVVAQFIVENRDGRTIGLTSAFEPDFRNRFISIAACSVDHLESSGLVLEGVALLVSYLFENFDLRKVYAESLERNYAQFSMGEGRLFEIEGRMREHEYIDGRYEDVILLAIHRDAWRDQHERIFGSKGHF